MKAFVNSVITKEELVKELKWHQEQDNFKKGIYWEEAEGKGCAVGCSLESISRRTHNDTFRLEDHSQYPKLLGIPEWLARLQDTIFEGVSDERSKLWPVEFTEAINVGSDLDTIKPKFLIFVLESNLERLQDKKFKEQREAVENVIKLWQRDDLYSDSWKSAAEAAGSAAGSAAEAAGSAAEAAARSAAWAAAEAAGSAAGSAAWAAAWAARSAAWAAWAAWAARSAAGSAAWAAAWAARSAAGSAAYEKFADKLLELIKECK